MGNFWSSSTVTPVERFVIPVPSHGTILINQASCNECDYIVRDNGTCKCGNLTVDGENRELGRTIKFSSLVSECSLIEFKGQPQVLGG